MSPALLVSGTWRLRHGEPVAREAAMIDLSPVELARPDDLFALVPAGIGGARAGAVPLAIVGPGAGAPISHLVHALDGTSALVARVDERPGPARPLGDRIAELFSDWRLRLNNNECYYTAGPALERSHDLPADSSPWALAEALYEAAEDGAWAGFAPRFRVPPRSRHADVSVFIAAGGGAPLLLASAFGRRRTSWDERVVTVVSARPRPDGGLARSAPREIRTDGAPLEAVLAAEVCGPVRLAGRRTRLAAEIPVESLRSGHVFAVTVEALRDPDDPAWGAAVAVVAYERTRGVADDPGGDHRALCTHVVGTLAGRGVAAAPGPDRLLGGLALEEAAP